MKMRDFIYVTVLIPRILMMQWDANPEAQIDLQITQSGDHFIYNDVEMEPVEIPDYPCIVIEDEDEGDDISNNE